MSPFVCEQVHPSGSPKNYRTRSDNPLVYLKKYCGDTVPPGFEMPDNERYQAINRLIGVYPLIERIRNIYRANASVFTERFRSQFLSILNGEDLSQFQTAEMIRTKKGSLETDWRALDIPITKHHIIPRCRGGMTTPKNSLWIPRSVHDDFHNTFGVYTPIEQFAYVALLFSDHNTRNFLDRVKDILLSKNQNTFYEEGIIEGNKLLH